MPISGAMCVETENDVERHIVAYLQKRGWVVDRVNVGVLYTRDRRPLHVGRPGQPDWRAKHPRLGYLEVEVKSTTGRLSPR